MISYELYKVLHIVGAFMVVAGLIAASAFAWANAGGALPAQHPLRKLAAATHGFGLLIALIAGFGMIARAQISFGQFWVLGKLGTWVILGGMMVVAKRLPNRAPLIWLLTFVFGGIAAYFAIFKP